MVAAGHFRDYIVSELFGVCGQRNVNNVLPASWPLPRLASWACGEMMINHVVHGAIPSLPPSLPQAS